MLESLEGGDRRGAIAAQVVQAHQAALRVLGERIDRDQLLRVDEAARERAIVLAARRGRGERVRAPGAPVAPLRLQPLGELGQAGVIVVAEQLADGRVLVARDPLERRRQVGVHVRRELQQRAAGNQRRAGLATQPIEPLAQARVRLARRRRRPEQRAETIDADRPGERGQAQQGGVLGREHEAACADLQRGRAEQDEADRRRRRRIVGERRGGHGRCHRTRFWARRRVRPIAKADRVASGCNAVTTR